MVSEYYTKSNEITPKSTSLIMFLYKRPHWNTVNIKTGYQKLA